MVTLVIGNANEPVEKVPLTNYEEGILGGHLTQRKHEIVDCGASYEITFVFIPPENLPGDFFYRLNTPISL